MTNGFWLDTNCEVTDLKGNHCPEKPTHQIEFKGKVISLCERCYQNVLAGAYIAHLAIRAVRSVDEKAKETTLKGIV